MIIGIKLKTWFKLMWKCKLDMVKKNDKQIVITVIFIVKVILCIYILTNVGIFFPQ